MLTIYKVGSLYMFTKVESEKFDEDGEQPMHHYFRLYSFVCCTPILDFNFQVLKPRLKL